MGHEVGNKFAVPIRAPEEPKLVLCISIRESVFTPQNLVTWEGHEGIYCIERLFSDHVAHISKAVVRRRDTSVQIVFGAEEKEEKTRVLYPVPISFLRKLHRGEVSIVKSNFPQNPAVA